MNPKIIAAVARVAPPLLIAVLAGLAIKSIFFDEEKKSETKPTDETPKSVPVIPPVQVPVAPKVSAPAPITFVPISEDLPPMPSKRPTILREDLAQIFQDGARALYRKDAVAELQNLGFGKTAAYEALSANGRFGSWLQIAPDGIIAWKA